MASKDKTELKTSVSAEVITDGAQQNVTELSRLLDNLQTKIADRKVELAELAEAQQEAIDQGEQVGSGGGDGDTGGGVEGQNGGGKFRNFLLMRKFAQRPGSLARGARGLGALGALAVVYASPKIEDAAYSVGGAMARFTGQDGIHKFNPWHVGKASVNWAGEKVEGFAKSTVGAFFSNTTRIFSLGSDDSQESKQQRAEQVKRGVVEFLFGEDAEMNNRWNDKVSKLVLENQERYRHLNSQILGDIAGLGLSGDATDRLASELAVDNKNRKRIILKKIDERARLKIEADYYGGKKVEAE